MDEETAANPQIRRSLLPVALSNRRNISSNCAMSMFQTSFLIRSDGLKSKLSGGCAICLFASDEPACFCSSSLLSSASCSVSANFLSLPRYLSRLAEPHLILVCKVALSPSLFIIYLTLYGVLIWRRHAHTSSFCVLVFFSLFFFLFPRSYRLSHRLFFPVCAFGWFFFVLVNKLRFLKY